MKEQVNLLIDAIQQHLFNDHLCEFSNYFAELPNLCEKIFPELASAYHSQFNQILLALLQAYENKDYLLVADLLEFELKPCLAEGLEDYQ